MLCKETFQHLFKELLVYIVWLKSNSYINCYFVAIKKGFNNISHKLYNNEI